ncbi:Protein STB5 [Colletotrichum orbiculare MAFF 240422]|uniref:Protein STB5 n=1 Tax=Colletotrichum orbiculare (strain 104-T / ATCC 96160 / CBS 514.97 / LARS 414 / MAFF 240422) TaxID=1213857 RepID=A0A484FXY5_COLOR|nr:Protein STB5 [Colletotrichum orbiculare MAFF 240422]
MPTSTSVRACLRCHAKKIKCTGYPACQSCTAFGVECEPHQRTRKSEALEALKQAKARIRWLEDQIYRNWGVECSNAPTGSSLLDGTLSQNDQETWRHSAQSGPSPEVRGAPDEFHASASDAPEISLVALNATGDMRYLGPSSGAFFAAYATSIARTLASDKDPDGYLAIRSHVVLLISIYGSYGPIGSSQWQLAGLAMRMATEIGLHYSPKVCNATEKDKNERACIFWTAYTVEMSLAYNLGRPPSIGDEHITTALPAAMSDALLAVHHVKHRQIQSRIISRVYCGNNAGEQTTMDQKTSVISGLQAQLDEWRAGIPTQAEEAPAYPHSYWDRLYHGTSFVLHRASPLCPNPRPQSLEKQGFHQLGAHTGWSFMLVDVPAWTRKCSVCLAIVSERWKEDLLLKLEAQFETLANDTLRVVSSAFSTQPPPPLEPQDRPIAADQTRLADDLSGTGNTMDAFGDFEAGVWEQFDMFTDVLGRGCSRGNSTRKRELYPPHFCDATNCCLSHGLELNHRILNSLDGIVQ